jgi:hypothetical protein
VQCPIPAKTDPSKRLRLSAHKCHADAGEAPDAACTHLTRESSFLSALGLVAAKERRCELASSRRTFSLNISAISAPFGLEIVAAST